MVEKCKMVEWVVAHRQKTKKWAIELAGGACSVCGYNRCDGALHFHHVRGEKEFDVSGSGLTRSKQSIILEIAKCVLLCANCHAEHHWSVA